VQESTNSFAYSMAAMRESVALSFGQRKHWRFRKLTLQQWLVDFVAGSCSSINAAALLQQHYCSSTIAAALLQPSQCSSIYAASQAARAGGRICHTTNDSAHTCRSVDGPAWFHPAAAA
jgi:hypothetical protein